MEIYKDQYNNAHKEITLQFKVEINFVVTNNKGQSITPEQVEKWFKDNIAALECERQILAGNSMQKISVTKI